MVEEALAPDRQRPAAPGDVQGLHALALHGKRLGDLPGRRLQRFQAGLYRRIGLDRCRNGLADPAVGADESNRDFRGGFDAQRRREVGDRDRYRARRVEAECGHGHFLEFRYARARVLGGELHRLGDLLQGPLVAGREPDFAQGLDCLGRCDFAEREDAGVDGDKRAMMLGGP